MGENRADRLSFCSAQASTMGAIITNGVDAVTSVHQPRIQLTMEKLLDHSCEQFGRVARELRSYMPRITECQKAMTPTSRLFWIKTVDIACLIRCLHLCLVLRQTWMP